MNRLFNLDNPFMQFLFRVSDLIILNLIFMLSCIPIVTIGASISALHSVCLKIVRGQESYMWQGFWKAFRQNFKQGTILWIISILLFIFINMDYTILNAADIPFFSYVKVALGTVSAILFSMFIYVFPIIAHFKCTIRQAIKNALFMTIGHLPFSIILVVMYSLIFLLATWNVKTLALVIAVATICGFSVVTLTACIIFDRIFKKYEPKQEPVPEYNE